MSHHALLAFELPSARSALVAESRTWVDKELVHLQRRLLEREVRAMWATVLGMVSQLEGHSAMNLQSCKPQRIFPHKEYLGMIIRDTCVPSSCAVAR